MKENIYLNWGTLARTWPSVLEASFNHQREYEINPTVSLFKGWGQLWEHQKNVAHFFKARPQDFYFRPNVTVAMNDYILGAELPEGDIVVTDLEYGSIVNICRVRAEKDQRRIVTVEIPLGHQIESDEHLIQIILSQLPSKTALILVSHIMTGTGLRLPLAKLAKETRARNIRLVVDGAHGPGATDLDFSTLEDVDFYGGNLHKWFRGPKGTGFGWAPERIQSSIKPIMGSWTYYETPKPFIPFGEGNRWAQSMLMSWCLNFAAFYSLTDAVNEWNKLGVQQVYKTLEAKRNLIEKEMTEVFGWKILSSTVPSLQSPLVTFQLPEQFAAKGYEILHDLQNTKNVTVAITPLKNSFALRLSAHVDVTDEQIIEGIQRLKEYFSKT